MSKTKGILYHRSNEKELRERSDWNELTEDEKKKLGRLGWFKTKSEQSFERIGKEELLKEFPMLVEYTLQIRRYNIRCNI